jgi:hypothetical protein
LSFQASDGGRDGLYFFSSAPAREHNDFLARGAKGAAEFPFPDQKSARTSGHRMLLLGVTAANCITEIQVRSMDHGILRLALVNHERFGETAA